MCHNTTFRTSAEPLHHVGIGKRDSAVIAPAAPLGTLVQTLSPNALLVPEARGIPVGGKVGCQLIRAAIDDIFQFLLCLGIAFGCNLRTAIGLPHIGIGQISLGHALGATAILIVVRCPFEKLGSLGEVLDDEVPHLFISFCCSLDRCGAEVLTRSEHGHAAKGCGQPGVEISSQGTRFAFAELLGLVAHL